MPLKILVFLTTVLAAGSCAYSQVMYLVTDDGIKKNYYAGGDEFTGPDLDTARWMNRYPWGRNLYCNKEQEYYTNGKNHRLQNGILSLDARREEVTERILEEEPPGKELKCGDKSMGVNLRQFPFTSGMLFSRQKFHYGYYEIRFKSSAGKGLWPAFWLYAGRESDEIDIFELKGEKNDHLHVDVHCPSGCSNYKTTLGLLRRNWGDYLPTNARWHESYNIVGIHWQPDGITWYLNGQGVAYWKGRFDYPMWVIANLAIPSDDGPFGPGPDATTRFPASFNIDYIRIWSGQPNQELPEQIFDRQDTGSRNQGVQRHHTARLAGKRRPEYRRSKLKQESVQVTISRVNGNNISVSLLGKVLPGFQLVVTDQNGSTLYSSNDPSAADHVFAVNLISGTTITITVNGRSIEHRM